MLLITACIYDGRTSQVVTLFHEMGHGLQHMLTTCPHGPAAGIGGVEWDAVELPSQFMENWCFDRATVRAGREQGENVEQGLTSGG